MPPATGGGQSKDEAESTALMKLSGRDTAAHTAVLNVTVYQKDGGETKNSYLFGTLPSGLLLVGVAEAAKCRGNACDIAHVEMRDGCMVIVNDDDRPVKFYYHAGHSPPVSPHSSEIIFYI